ncbi:hypothetical protein G3576_15285 [Roseomonas stagni]|uniref:Uncharacterized protein n=1 Tax=Falsiroseomonas algicola TaxID=2716930 RepID=A0A6M1LM17_9PROT|nr:hypothetical protein [Falsiroseomonas algicola]NGM21386.1 hypothetical protein [Falsiroseomonas algicola]
MIGQGYIYAHVARVHEGADNQLFWGLHVALDSSDHVLAVSCDWMTLAMASWRGLGELSLSDVVKPELMGCSFYIDGEHLLARLLSLSVTAGEKPATFHATLSMEVPTADGGASLPPLDIEAALRFDGYIVVPGNITPPISDEEAATRLLGTLIDTTSVAAPVWDRFRFVFAPRLVEAG